MAFAPATLCGEMEELAPAASPEFTEPVELPADVPVSIVLCVLNEERHLAQAVAHALDQDHSGPLELVIALGPSRDRTDEIAASLAAADPRVRWVRNPSPTGSTPAGLNAALAVTAHPVVAR